MSSGNRYAIIKDGNVVNTIIWDGKPYSGIDSSLQPILIEEDVVAGVGYSYKDGVFSPPPLSEEEKELQEQLDIEASAEMKNALMAYSSNKIGVLTDAADLGLSTPEEAQELVMWKKYRILLNRVDISSSSSIQWPLSPEDDNNSPS